MTIETLLLLRPIERMKRLSKRMTDRSMKDGEIPQGAPIPSVLEAARDRAGARSRRAPGAVTCPRKPTLGTLRPITACGRN